MARRRYKAPPFEGAEKGITELEQRVAMRTTDVQFTLNDVVDWLFPPEVVNALKTAYPFTRSIDKGNSTDPGVILPVMTTGMTHCQLHVRLEEDLSMLSPDMAYVRKDVADRFVGSPIHAAFAQVYSTHLQFNKMRKVVAWANEHLTAANAKDYIPWLAGVLPRDHALHYYEGVAKEPAVSPPPEILGYMRECGALMGSALLCPPVTSEEDAKMSNFAVRFAPGGALPDSQSFWLL